MDDLDGNLMPVITLEVMTAAEENEDIQNNEEESATVQESTNHNVPVPEDTKNTRTGIHFLTNSTEEVVISADGKEPQCRSDADYMMKYNGTVICKLCGEVLKSRTHFYRHKTKQHFVPSLNPSPLFQCAQCLVYFKSRKGYIGHMATRHAEASGPSPVLPSEDTSKEKPPEIKEEPDIEMSIPASSVANCKTTNNKTVIKCPETKRISKLIKGTIPVATMKDREERRSREEKLVADIIDRVRRECEAQGSGGAMRRGYTRRTTVMHT